MIRETLTVAEVAEQLQVSKVTVTQAVHANKIDAVRCGNKMLILADSITQYLPRTYTRLDQRREVVKTLEAQFAYHMRERLYQKAYQNALSLVSEYEMILRQTIDDQEAADYRKKRGEFVHSLQELDAILHSAEKTKEGETDGTVDA